jgi:uncharacterized protein (DUF433 family)
MQQNSTPKVAETFEQADIETELVPRSDLYASVISIDPERMGGIPCFVGTRVPIQTLWDHLENGDSLEVFLNDFEGVTREQAVAVLHLALKHLLEKLPTP